MGVIFSLPDNLPSQMQKKWAIVTLLRLPTKVKINLNASNKTLIFKMINVFWRKTKSAIVHTEYLKIGTFLYNIATKNIASELIEH